MCDRRKTRLARKITTLIFVSYCAFAIGLTSTINKRFNKR
jgi:hypothetical protein